MFALGQSNPMSSSSVVMDSESVGVQTESVDVEMVSVPLTVLNQILTELRELKALVTKSGSKAVSSKSTKSSDMDDLEIGTVVSTSKKASSVASKSKKSDAICTGWYHVLRAMLMVFRDDYCRKSPEKWQGFCQRIGFDHTANIANKISSELNTWFKDGHTEFVMENWAPILKSEDWKQKGFLNDKKDLVIQTIKYILQNKKSLEEDSDESD